MAASFLHAIVDDMKKRIPSFFREGIRMQVLLSCWRKLFLSSDNPPCVIGQLYSETGNCQECALDFLFSLTRFTISTVSFFCFALCYWFLTEVLGEAILLCSVVGL